MTNEFQNGGAQTPPEVTQAASQNNSEKRYNLAENEIVLGIPVDRTNATATQLTKEIEEQGRIPYSRFMQVSLFGEDGYYSQGKVTIGKSAEGKDFSTTPEATEYFGATIGVGLKKVWEAMGKPSTFDIVVMGAGQGAMAASLQSNYSHRKDSEEKRLRDTEHNQASMQMFMRQTGFTRNSLDKLTEIAEIEDSTSAIDSYALYNLLFNILFVSHMSKGHVLDYRSPAVKAVLHALRPHVDMQIWDRFQQTDFFPEENVVQETRS